MTLSRLAETFDGLPVLVTGHTGFKGAWLSAWLRSLGATVHGLSLAPEPRGAFHDLEVATFVADGIGDVRDAGAVDEAVRAANPSMVFHLAAQPLVRRSWLDRRTTYETNIMGTVNVLESALGCEAVRGVVAVTTDKVYANDESGRAFAEGDRLGGHDPYSASKAAAEIAVVPYRQAQFMEYAPRPIVTVRAGNVIGGGDWSEDRLVPDVVRALSAGENIVLRRPDAVRPWQHVLDCVSGYLLVADAILRGQPVASSYNFAHRDAAATVLDVTQALVSHWGASPDTIVIERDETTREAGLLTLDPSLAERELGWRPAWSLDESIRESVRFYRDPSVGLLQLGEYAAAGADA